MTDAPELLADARDLVDALTAAGAEFLVIGAHALAAHGIVRATGDFHVLIRPTDENAACVVAALEAFGAPLEAHGVVVDDFAREDTVYQLGLPPRRIDILTSITGVTFEQACADRLHVSLKGREIAVIGREALLANKLATGRAKDLLDARALAAHEPGDA